MAVLEKQAALGYLPKSDIQDRIDSHEIPLYSVIFTSDTKETFVLDADENLQEINGRVYVFDSVIDAIDKLNSSKSTYVGQLVAIKVDDAYRGYIVNQSESGFYVTDLCNNPETIDYNELNNKPIIVKRGTLAEPIVLSDLEDDIYEIKGYLNTPDGKTINSVVGNIVVIESSSLLGSDIKYIKRIAQNNIFDYQITSAGVETSQYLTEEYVKDNGFLLEKDLDPKAQALGYIKRADMEKYITEYFELYLKSYIDDEIDLKVQESDEVDIASLFAEITT